VDLNVPGTGNRGSSQSHNFIKNIRKNSDYISLIYRDPAFRKIVVCALRAPAQNVSFLKMTFKGHVDVIVVCSLESRPNSFPFKKWPKTECGLDSNAD
jgi:hypothetical protein